MNIATIIALLFVSLIGLSWWVLLLTLATHAKKIEAPKTRWGHVQGVALNFTAAFLLITPLLIILWKAALG